MRKTLLSSLPYLPRHAFRSRPPALNIPSTSLQATVLTPSRSLAQVRPDREVFPEVWFTSTVPFRSTPGKSGFENPEAPPDERTLKLGKTLRVLQSRLPTLLASPLPPEILSPHISLHLFPSTHPHLPTVSGRVAYHAALWTAPMAWGRVPLVGNVKLIILSDRIVKNGSGTSCWMSSDRRATVGNERLIVRWKTTGKSNGKGIGALYRGIGASGQLDKISEWLGGLARDDEEFCGLFIFEFDEEGRIITHTIEHADQSSNWDKTSRVVTLTDWLLGRMNGRNKKVPELAWSCVGDQVARRRFQRRRDDR